MISKYIVLHEGDKCLMVLRPYQFYAVEEILDKVQNSTDNGFIWHTTGAGKTLTSFKAAQLVSELDGVDKVMFADFIRAAACRSGRILNLHDIAGDVGVSDDTAKRWMKELEKSGIVFFLHPYSNSLLKRTIKTPKMYFFDTGLVSYLTRYSNPEILMNGAINGAILENYVVSEIIKTYSNSAQDCLLHYYRDKNSNEIDLIMERDGQLHPIEIKKSINPPTQITGAFKLLDKASVPRGTGAIICLRETLSAIDSSTYIVPVWMI